MTYSLFFAAFLSLACLSTGEPTTHHDVSGASGAPSVPGAPNAPGDPAAPGATWRTYDLAALAPSLPTEARTANLLPALAPPDLFRGSGGGARESAADSLAELAARATGDEFEREGSQWNVTGEGRLEACASAEAHKLLEREFALFGDVFRSSVRVRIDIIEGDLGAQGLAVRVPAATADELVARALAQGRVRTAQLVIAPGDEVHVDQTRELRVISDYDVEVAQLSLAYMPRPQSYRIGTQLLARAAAVTDGVQLALVVRQVDEVAPLRERSIEYVNHIAIEQSVVAPSSMLAFQSPRVVQHAEALTTFLPKGEAVLVRSSFANLDANSRCTFVLRALGEPTAPTQGVDLYANGYRVDVVDVSRFAPPSVRVGGALLQRGVGDRVLDAFFSDGLWDREEPFSASAVQSDDELQFASERYFPWREELSNERLGPWLVLQPASVDPTATHTRNFDPTALAGIARPKPVELEVVLRRGDAIAARWSASMVEGRRSAFAVGGESIGLDGAAIEIAQAVSVFDPQARVFFDGLVVALEPRRLASGAVDVDVTARAMLLDAEPTWAVGMAGATPPRDRATWTTLVSDERVSIPATGEPRSALLGLAGKTGLTLEITLR